MELCGASRTSCFLAVLCLAPVSWANAAPPGDLQKGQVIVSSYDPAAFLVYDHDGVFLESIDLSSLLDLSPYDRASLSASVFDKTAGRIYGLSVAGRFGQYGELFQVDLLHPHAAQTRVDNYDFQLSAATTLARDARGNLYLGNGGEPVDCCYKQVIRKLGLNLAVSDSYVVDIGSSPIWISALDVTADGGTLYYTSFSGPVWRFDTVNRTQLASFVIPETAGQIRLLPPFDGSGLLVATSASRIRRLDAAGNTVQSYDLPGESCGDVELDPTGPSFWVLTRAMAVPHDRHLYRLALATGAIELGPVNLGSVNATQLCTYAPSPKFRTR